MAEVTVYYHDGDKIRSFPVVFKGYWLKVPGGREDNKNAAVGEDILDAIGKGASLAKGETNLPTSAEDCLEEISESAFRASKGSGWGLFGKRCPKIVQIGRNYRDRENENEEEALRNSVECALGYIKEGVPYVAKKTGDEGKNTLRHDLKIELAKQQAQSGETNKEHRQSKMSVDDIRKLMNKK